MFKLLSYPRKAIGAAVVVCIAVVLFTGETATGQITGWDFEDGTLQGWTNVPTPNPAMLYQRDPEPILIEMDARMDPGSGGAWRANGVPQGGMFMVSPSPFEPANSSTDGRDGAHDAPIVLRSPTFELTGSGHISAHLLGGTQGEAVILPNNYSDLGGVSANTNGSDPTGDSSYLGLALRRDSTGDYVLHASRTSNSSSSYQQPVFDEFSLASIAATYPGELFTIDLIDTAHGSFGSLTMDTVSVPAAAEASVVTGGGMWNVLERLSIDAVDSIGAMDTLLALPNGDPGIALDHNYQAAVINIDDLAGNPGMFAGADLFQAGQTSFAMRATGVINVIEAGEITFGLYANDGGRLTIDGNVVLEDGGVDFGSPTLGSASFSVGAHAVEFEFFQNNFAATVELYVATTLGAFTSLNEATWELLVASDLEPPEGLPGDYNNDGVVNAADYVVWRDNLGGDMLLNEGASIGTVDADDYSFWVSQFGNGSGGGSAQWAGVPEPSSICLLIAMLLIAAIGKRVRL